MAEFRIASIRGIAIEIHWSWLLVFGLLSWTLSDGFFPSEYPGWRTGVYWTVGVLSALLLFGTVLIHELAHAVVARRRGLPVPRITLFIFGGVSHMARQPRSAGEEFAIAAAGPATSLLIAITTGIGLLVFGPLSDQVEAVLAYLTIVNVMLAVFNIIPGFPLDGGRVLRSIAWRRTRSFKRATRVAASTGQVVGFMMMVGGGMLLLTGLALQGLWLIFIGWFLVGAARNEAEALQIESVLSRLSARDVMREDWVTVTPGTSVSEVVDLHMLGQGERSVVVANDGVVHGIVTVSDVRRVPRSEWPVTPVQQVMTARDAILTVAPAVPAVQVLMTMAQRGLNQVPVIEDGRMIGLISRRELIDRVQLAESLGPGRDAPA